MACFVKVSGVGLYSYPPDASPKPSTTSPRGFLRFSKVFSLHFSTFHLLIQLLTKSNAPVQQFLEIFLGADLSP